MIALRKVAGVLLVLFGLWHFLFVYDFATAADPGPEGVTAGRPETVRHLIEGSLLLGIGAGSVWAGVWLLISRPEPPLKN